MSSLSPPSYKKVPFSRCFRVSQSSTYHRLGVVDCVHLRKEKCFVCCCLLYNKTLREAAD
jgi:hypothetical protein